MGYKDMLKEKVTGGFNSQWNNRQPGMKGAVQGAVLGAVVALVMLFVGIFMISEVATVTAINNSSDFYNVYSTLVDNVSTIYSVLVLALIIVVLALAINYLRGFGGGGGQLTQ